MADQPKMKFEEIVEKAKGKTFMKTIGKIPKPNAKVEEIDCPECGEKMVISIKGPRSAFGKCRCGLVIMS